MRTVSRTSARIGVSIAVPQTSPSPWAAWPSPIDSRAPSWKTGRNSVAPAVRWRVSMLPPWRSGGIVERGPVAGRDAQLAAERDDRDADAGQELGPLRRPPARA